MIYDFAFNTNTVSEGIRDGWGSSATKCIFYIDGVIITHRVNTVMEAYTHVKKVDAYTFCNLIASLDWICFFEKELNEVPKCLFEICP